MALTDDELNRLNGALLEHPIPEMPPSAVPGYGPITDEERDRLNAPTPGYQAEAPSGPSVISTPIQTPSWEDSIIERNSAEQRRFRQTLLDEAARQGRVIDPRLYQGHHIIPLSEYPQLNDLRDRLNEWGIDINDALVNGVLLPVGPDIGPEVTHPDTQWNQEYREAIEKRFESVTNAEDARQQLGIIRDELRNGTFISPKQR